MRRVRAAVECEAVKRRLKAWLFGLLGKDPEAIVVSFWSGDDALAARMVEEIRGLVPDRRHYVVAARMPSSLPAGVTVVTLKKKPGHSGDLYLELRRTFRRYRIGLAPVLFTQTPDPLRAAAFFLAPRRILAYNADLERHHLQWSAPIAAYLFLHGVPLDRIFLRPSWLFPWKRDRTRVPDKHCIVEGRPPAPHRRRVAILSPYFPYPLSHGGAVRIYHLLREAAREFDVYLFAFAKKPLEQEFTPLLDYCARIVVVEPPRYREPRWSTLAPPEIGEYDSRPMRRLLAGHGAGLVQVEYAQLAAYNGDVLVEHDVTWDLYRQVYERDRTAAAWWNYFRWRLFESRVVRRFRRVVVMSAKDAALLGRGEVIGNGVDLERFRPEPECPGQRLLFIGSFNHFPNIEAFRFFHDEVWPRLRERFPEMSLTVVAGRDHLRYWRQFTGLAAMPADARVRILDFVRDIRPLYVEANLVLAPTTVSAGTNLKVLEAMAMERAVVSTSSGCAGLGLSHGKSVWIADDATAFAEGVARLILDSDTRARLAAAARVIAERDFDWSALGEKQRALWRALLDERSSP